VGETASSMKDSYLSAILLRVVVGAFRAFQSHLLSCSIARSTLSPRTSDDADPPPSQEPRQPLLAVAQWHVPKVLAVRAREGRRRTADGAAAVERVEDRDAIRMNDVQPRAAPVRAIAG
jgi:hypothetical protein